MQQVSVHLCCFVLSYEHIQQKCSSHCNKWPLVIRKLIFSRVFTSLNEIQQISSALCLGSCFQLYFWIHGQWRCGGRLMSYFHALTHRWALHTHTRCNTNGRRQTFIRRSKFTPSWASLTAQLFLILYFLFFYFKKKARGEGQSVY